MLLGPEKRIRDSISFTTEKNEPATLVMYVTDFQAAGADRIDLEAAPNCEEQVAGIPLVGVYGVALVINGVLVNDVTIPAPGGGAKGAMALPLRNLPHYNYAHWGQGTPVAYDVEAKRTEPTKLLRLADFNGDGKAWEFRLVQPGGICGHLNTLLAGYSPARRAVVIFPILAGPFRSDWSDNFFAHPSTGSGQRIETTFACGDHGNETEVRQEYVYDAAREAWVLSRHRERACEMKTPSAQGVETLAAPIALTIGSSEGAPGEHVTIPVSIDTHDVPVARIDHAIVVDPRISVAAIEGLDFERADGQATAAEDGVGPINCGSELVESCQWALSMRLDGNFTGKAVVYFVKLLIPPDATPGTYRLSNVNLSAIGRSGKKMPIDGVGGELRVRAGGEKS